MIVQHKKELAFRSADVTELSFCQSFYLCMSITCV